jgi:hypothetical protein
VVDQEARDAWTGILGWAAVGLGLGFLLWPGC